MPQIIYVLPDNTRREVAAPRGESVMRTALTNLVPGIIGECGGVLSCATCHVVVDDEWADLLDPRSEDEMAMLETVAVGPRPTSRLSCQILIDEQLDGLVVHVPEAQE